MGQGSHRAARATGLPPVQQKWLVAPDNPPNPPSTPHPPPAAHLPSSCGAHAHAPLAGCVRAGAGAGSGNSPALQPQAAAFGSAGQVLPGGQLLTRHGRSRLPTADGEGGPPGKDTAASAALRAGWQDASWKLANALPRLGSTAGAVRGCCGSDGGGCEACRTLRSHEGWSAWRCDSCAAEDSSKQLRPPWTRTLARLAAVPHELELAAADPLAPACCMRTLAPSSVKSLTPSKPLQPSMLPDSPPYCTSAVLLPAVPTAGVIRRRVRFDRGCWRSVPRPATASSQPATDCASVSEAHLTCCATAADRRLRLAARGRSPRWLLCWASAAATSRRMDYWWALDCKRCFNSLVWAPRARQFRTGHSVLRQEFRPSYTYKLLRKIQLSKSSKNWGAGVVEM